MSHKPVIRHFEAGHGSVRSYAIGFGASLILTAAAYVTVSQNLFGRSVTIGVIAALAIMQLVVQLVYFLHFGRESKPRWNLMAFLFMLMVLFIVVFGSIWIMNNLSYHHDSKSPAETAKEIIRDEGIR